MKRKNETTMTLEEAWRVYEQNTGIIHSIVKRFPTSKYLSYEDLFNEASLAAVEFIRKYNPEKGAITTWLRNNVQPYLMDYTKKHCSDFSISIHGVNNLGRNAGLEVASFEKLNQSVGDEDFMSPELVFYDNHSSSEMDEMLSALSEDERKILILHYGFYDEPQSFGSIAKLMKKSQPYVKNLHNEAINKLRDNYF